jgi:transporter family protein
MRIEMDSWQFWAFLSAIFAALTAIFGKIGVSGIDSDFATLIRTIVILGVIALVVAIRGAAQPLATVSQQTWIFLVLSGLATGASWLCYFRALKLGQVSQVAPVDKLSVVLVAIIGVIALGETLTLRAWTGVALVAGGAALLAFK